jgi:hypothetical protein
MSQKVIALTLFGSLLMSSAYAGPRSGGGGDFRCAEYADLADRIASTLAEVGQEKVNSVNDTIRVDDMERVSKRLVCIPVSSLDRQARSYPASGRTDLLVFSWEGLSRPEKVRLTAHEMSILAGYEVDGEYSVSNKLVEILQKSSKPIVGSSRSDSPSPMNYVVAKAGEIALKCDLPYATHPIVSLQINGKEIAKIGTSSANNFRHFVMGQNPGTAEIEAMTQLLNRILVSAKDGQNIRINLDKLPKKFSQKDSEAFTNAFQIENDL